MRLTNKVEIKTSDGHTDFAYDTSAANIIELPHLVEGQRYTGEAIYKLGQLEDNEEELGINLVILFKAIRNGIWVKTKNNISKHLTVALKKRHHTKEYWLFYRPYSHVYLKDYGKTWALTKEELEK